MPKVRKRSMEEGQQVERAQPHQEPGHMPHVTRPHGATLEDAYPHVAAWIDGGGWIELGQHAYRRSFIRGLDIGGMRWEGITRYGSVDALLRDAEEALIHLEARGDS
jgi:hypothetical protein